MISPVIFQQQLDILRASRPIHIIRVAPTENLIPAFSNNTFVTLAISPLRQLIVVTQFGIAESRRLDAEQIADFLAVNIDLPLEFIAAIEERQAVIISFADNLDVTSTNNIAQQIDYIWRPALRLVKQRPSDRQRYAKIRMRRQ